jgi:hypothetical protein
VGVLDGFLSTWSKAKATFGEGTPEGGAQFDGSGTLNQLKSNLDSAAPGSKWTGTAATAYGTANTEHQRVIGELGGLDKRLAAHVDESARIVSAGRDQLAPRRGSRPRRPVSMRQPHRRIRLCRYRKDRLRHPLSTPSEAGR